MWTLSPDHSSLCLANHLTQVVSGMDRAKQKALGEGAVSSSIGWAWLTLSVLLLASPVLQADIYKYQDRYGNLHFTDRPIRSEGYRLLWQSRSSTSPRSRQGQSRIDLAALEINRSRYSDLIDTVARVEQLRPELLHAVVRAESAYDPRALSKTGAQGLMQLMPGTAARYGVRDRWDPKANLSAGAQYLRDLLELFKYDLRLALAAYNAGENAVKKYGNRIPPFPETQTYVSRVLAYYQENRRNRTASRQR